MRPLVLLALVGCSGPAAPVDAGDWVYDATPITSCDAVPASVTTDVIGGADVDTHLACVGSLMCGLCGFGAMCVDGRLHVWESGSVCLPDAGPVDASSDASLVTSCDEVSANPSIPRGAVSGDVDTRIPCVAPLICSVGCVNVMCESGTLHLTEAGHLCNDAGGDASMDAGR